MPCDYEGNYLERYKRLQARRAEYANRLRSKYPKLDRYQVKRIVERKIR